MFRRAERALHESRFNTGIVVVFKTEVAARGFRALAPEFHN